MQSKNTWDSDRRSMSLSHLRILYRVFLRSVAWADRFRRRLVLRLGGRFMRAWSSRMVAKNVHRDMQATVVSGGR